MITSVLTKRWRQCGPGQPSGQSLPPARTFPRTAYAAAAAAAVTITTLGLTGAGSASAASAVTQSSMGPMVYTTSQAGYVTGGRYFRYVATTVRVPYLQYQAGNNGSAEVVLGSRVGPPATLRVATGGGTGSISYVWSSGTEFHTGYMSGVAPAPGDLLRLSIYYGRGQSRDHFTAADITQGVSQSVSVDVVPVIYTAAEAAGVVNNATVVAPTVATRLWAFKDSRVTTYSGVHGTLLGPWTTSQIIDTTTGTTTGAVVINSPVLWNSGQNFGVWLRPTA
jgi:hypothetical protein